jgi:hypothetical protein
MIELTQNAQKSLDQYLHQARAYLKGAKSVDAAEVEQNITEHIENELAGAAEPVSAEELDTVLQKLGSPQQWVGEEELPWWRKMILRLHHGPEDWRLAYISFGVFVLAFFAGRLGFIVLLLASFIISRATLSAIGDHEKLKAQKWLLYPCLTPVYLALLGALLAAPLLGVVPLAYELEQQFIGRVEGGEFIGRLEGGERQYWLVACAACAGSVGLWWLIQGIVFMLRPNIPRVLFRPFAAGFNRKRALLLICVSLVVLVGSLVIVSWSSWLHI